MSTISEPEPASLRERYRAQVRQEVKEAALGQLAEAGPGGLSISAIGKQLGVSGPALYRYFASRDDLLTALIIDAYNDVGQAVEDADASADRADFVGRWLAVTHGVRDWALAVPHEYMLIYGSPVPGYQAPTDTVAAAIRGTTVLGTILDDAVVAGVLHDTG
ncbi:MAG TPA: TetR/AcrR family transcriptional regulator, partial [Candidatus Dormibacteraeota bacterium]